MFNRKSIFRALGLAASLAMLMPDAMAEPLTAAVAANVKYAFDDLAAEFRKETGIEVQAVSGASGKIVAQVKSGAPFDVFLSADTESPDALYRGGWAAGSPRVYAYGVLVLWTRKDIDLARGVAAVDDPAVRTVAIANPRVAPYGRAAMKALHGAGLGQAVEHKLVYGENIAQTVQFVDSGAADIAFTAKSLVVAPELAGKGRWVEVPKAAYDPIAQSAVVLRHGAQTQSAAAQRFVDFLFTPNARAIFEKYGYRLP